MSPAASPCTRRWLTCSTATIASSSLRRRAHHALVAAPLSTERAAIAVDASASAARAMRRGFAYERSASLFAEAVSVAERLPRRQAWASLPVEHAEAVLACGRLADSRRLFRHAVDAAEDHGDTVTLARAAAGLGGVWLNEHRDPIEHQRMLASQRRALTALGDEHLALRRRLEMRLAAEAVYDGEPVDGVRDALARARECGDGSVLAEALSLAHHALMAPGSGEELLPLAEELIAVASAAGEGLLAVMGLMWRTVDLYQLDRPGAERSLGELRQRVEALGCLSIAYVVALIDVMRMTRDGRIDEAEDAARAAFELGVAVGDADATGYYAAHVMRIRSLQGREAELLDLVPSCRRLAADDGSRAGPARFDRRRRGTRRRCGPGAFDPRWHAGRGHRSVEHVARRARLARRRRRRARRSGPGA